MKQSLVIAAFAALLILFSCTGSLNTYDEYSKSIDFGKYKSYAWIPSDDTNLNNQSIERMFGKMVTTFADEELKKKGMVLDTKNPDAVFRFRMGIENMMEYSQSPTLSVGVGVGYGYGMPGYYAGASIPVAGGTVSEERIAEAFLIIEMFEASTGYILWTGGARKTTQADGDNAKNVKLALHSVFSRLPVKHKTK